MKSLFNKARALVSDHLFSLEKGSDGKFAGIKLKKPVIDRALTLAVNKTDSLDYIELSEQDLRQFCAGTSSGVTAKGTILELNVSKRAVFFYISVELESTPNLKYSSPFFSVFSIYCTLFLKIFGMSVLSLNKDVSVDGSCIVFKVSKENFLSDYELSDGEVFSSSFHSDSILVTPGSSLSVVELAKVIPSNISNYLKD